MQPFLKWAGGKRWLTTSSTHLLPKPHSYERYYEPFLGSGAVLFYMEPEQGVLSDINGDLINAYQIVKDDWRELQNVLSDYQKLHSADFYYQTRANVPDDKILKAARFIYLNRTCWNGLYRVNLKGEFNVPIGTKTKVTMETDNFEELSERFGKYEFLVSDFEAMINRTQKNDFLFVDPPYTVKHNLNGFVKYNENLFSWDDQIRLRNAVVRAINRGVKVLVLNADHASIVELYYNVGTMYSIDRASVISGNASARGIYTELAVKCW